MARYHYKYRKPQRRGFPVRWILALLLIAALLCYPFIEANMLTIQRTTLAVKGLPNNLRNLKIAFVSDIHRGMWFSQSRVEELVRTLNGLSADVIILGGDYADDSDGAIDFFRDLPPLSARMGAYAVVGNNDRTEPESNLSVLVGEIKGKGIIPLVNNVSSIKLGSTYLYIAGVDDFYNGFPDVAGVAAQVKAEDFVIFVGHSPDLMPAVLSAVGSDGDNHWFDLALFGHTHGGQINLFGYTPYRNLRTEVGARYLSGWVEENRASILISNGVGTSHLPVRLMAVPQVHLITLKAK